MKLDYQTRKLLKIVLNHVAREKNAYSLEEMANKALKANEMQRQAFAGGYGQETAKRAPKIKAIIPAGYKPRKVNTAVVECGIATAPDMTSAERIKLMELVRKSPIKSTVRVIPNGAFAWCNTLDESKYGRGEIKLVSDYAEQNEVAEKAEPKRIVTVNAPVMSDVKRYEHIIGYIGNVE